MPDPLDPLGSPEEIIKQLLMQRGQTTLAASAEKDAAFRAQVAQTRAARQAIRLPQNEAYGTTEDGQPIRAAKPTGSVWLGTTKSNPTGAAENIAKYGPHPADFQGMGLGDIAATIDSIPSQMEVARFAHADAERGKAHGRAGTLPAFIPSDAVLSESDNLPRTGEENVHLPNAAPGVYKGAPTTGQPVPGSAGHPVERMFGHLDDVVAQGGYPALVAAHPDSALSAIAHQLEARRMREMGAWDPSVASGGNF